MRIYFQKIRSHFRKKQKPSRNQFGNICTTYHICNTYVVHEKYIRDTLGVRFFVHVVIQGKLCAYVQANVVPECSKYVGFCLTYVRTGANICSTHSQLFYTCFWCTTYVSRVFMCFTSSHVFQMWHKYVGASHVFIYLFHRFTYTLHIYVTHLIPHVFSHLSVFLCKPDGWLFNSRKHSSIALECR